MRRYEKRRSAFGRFFGPQSADVQHPVVHTGVVQSGRVADRNQVRLYSYRGRYHVAHGEVNHNRWRLGNRQADIKAFFNNVALLYDKIEVEILTDAHVATSIRQVKCVVIAIGVRIE